MVAFVHIRKIRAIQANVTNTEQTTIVVPQSVGLKTDAEKVRANG